MLHTMIYILLMASMSGTVLCVCSTHDRNCSTYDGNISYTFIWIIRVDYLTQPLVKAFSVEEAHKVLNC